MTRTSSTKKERRLAQYAAQGLVLFDLRNRVDELTHFLNKANSVIEREALSIAMGILLIVIDDIQREQNQCA